ncbi:MAG TPA: 4-alpha-glucanotransferase, partial [Elusimicrobiales bacterium]|nr:4-alpha-glucanotransferase [Elusimicrobiales bacterium]
MIGNFCNSLLKRKSAGIFIPLFSMRSLSDWGIGDFKSFCSWIKWAEQNKISIIQILPINEIAPESTSPYSSLSAFAIDPIYLTVSEIKDVKESPKILELIKSEKISRLISVLNQSETVEYANVRKLKYKIFTLAFERFFKNHWINNTERALEFKEFIKDNDYWVESYSVFRMLKDIHRWHSWTYWQVKLKSCDENFIKQYASHHSYKVLFYKYLQWLCDVELKTVSACAKKCNVSLFGDVPFMINQESADVWANQDIFDISLEIGSPPDDFNSVGQKWGLPSYNWWNLEASSFKWWRERVRFFCKFYDFFRMDHIVGFFRTWIISKRHKKPDFDLPNEDEQKARGERFLSMICEEAKNSCPVAEDLGVIPDFVKETLLRFNIPGYKVFRWQLEGDDF